MKTVKQYYEKKLERIRREIKDTYQISYNRYEEKAIFNLIGIELIKESRDLYDEKNYFYLEKILNELAKNQKFKLSIIKSGQEEILESALDYEIRKEENKIEKLKEKEKKKITPTHIKPATLEITHMPHRELGIKLKTKEGKEILSYQFKTDTAIQPMRTIIEEFAKVNKYQITEETHISEDEYLDDLIGFNLEDYTSGIKGGM